jgi:hypothetical protein
MSQPGTQDENQGRAWCRASRVRRAEPRNQAGFTSPLRNGIGIVRARISVVQGDCVRPIGVARSRNIR